MRARVCVMCSDVRRIRPWRGGHRGIRAIVDPAGEIRVYLCISYLFLRRPDAPFLNLQRSTANEFRSVFFSAAKIEVRFFDKRKIVSRDFIPSFPQSTLVCRGQQGRDLIIVSHHDRR